MNTLDIRFENQKNNYLNTIKNRYKNNQNFDWNVEWHFTDNSYVFLVYRKKPKSLFWECVNENFKYHPEYKLLHTSVTPCYVCKKYFSKKFITWGYLINVICILENKKSYEMPDGIEYLCHKCNRFYKKQYDKLQILNEARLQINRIIRKQSEIKKEKHETTSTI
jgi:hypothetical protein